MKGNESGPVRSLEAWMVSSSSVQKPREAGRQNQGSKLQTGEGVWPVSELQKWLCACVCVRVCVCVCVRTYVCVHAGPANLAPPVLLICLRDTQKEVAQRGTFA
jgi:hypothetical protein